MKVKISTSQKFLNGIKIFVKEHTNTDLVARRISRNIHKEGVKISKQIFWRKLIMCFVTTQQNSGANSRVRDFLNSNSPILKISYCLESKNIKKESFKELRECGLRRNESIAKEIQHAVTIIKNENEWIEILHKLKELREVTDPEKEREVANYLRKKFKGIGPKQSRNLIQSIGLSQYEIPLDSRIIKVLKELNFAIPISSKALADENYYCFALDIIQDILEKINIIPCVFDACAFVSFEPTA